MAVTGSQGQGRITDDILSVDDSGLSFLNKICTFCMSLDSFFVTNRRYSTSVMFEKESYNFKVAIAGS
ncbi:unnamed protein product [Clonostachys rosea]|uniref:Uncharacterized protein n=1 Tax=Bionectria ochroleuca TaxID=29856 RepID=A0ABY6UGV6_BIOOC|nr:unnamed protein product [Clonostachys rosea]